MAVTGVGGITMLPIGLELGCELTRNSDASSAVLWFSYVYFLSRYSSCQADANLKSSGNLVTIIFVLVEGALRASPTADPPLNMRKSLIFNGIFILAGCCSVFFLKGKQARREKDARMRDEQQQRIVM